MKKKVEKYQDAIFVVTQERSCPVYNVGQEIKIENYCLSVSSYKPGCLYLTNQITEIISSRDSFGGFSKYSSQKSVFNCGGCDGIIYFELKKDKDFSTLQMKLLNEAEERRRRQHLDKFFNVMRKINMFEPLDDDALSDLILLLDFRSIPIKKIVLKKGSPGTALYIILKGLTVLLDDDGTKLTQMGTGEIFGEMSLLSGEPVSNTIQTVEPTQLALLSMKNFKLVITKYPILQLFIFKMLIDRAQTIALRTGKITSGMTGKIEEIAVVDLMQLVNLSKKTGGVEFRLDKGKALVFFNQGEIIHASYQEQRNKEAIFAILNEKEGIFTYKKGLPGVLEKSPPIGDFTALLMAGLQKIDEESIEPGTLENHT